MKSLKKIGILLFAVCFLMLYPSVSVHAAEGTFQFSDPTAKVGEDVTVKAKISTGGEAIGDGFDCNILSYFCCRIRKPGMELFQSWSIPWSLKR